MKDKILRDELRQKIKVSFLVEDKPDNESDMTTYDIFFRYYYCLFIYFLLLLYKTTSTLFFCAS